MITHKCPEFRIIELFPGHILGDRIEGRQMKDGFYWTICDDSFCSILQDKKCPFCKIELDELRD